MATLQQQVDSDDPASGCPTAATALAQSDGTPTDLVAGPGAAQLHAEVVATRAAVGCP